MSKLTKDEKLFKKKFHALLLMRDYTAAKKLVEESDLTDARRQELFREVDEAKRRFWKNFFEEDLYAGIPAVYILFQPLVWALSAAYRQSLWGSVLSGALFGGMLWFYRKTIRPLWRWSKRPGGMAAFERDKKLLGILLWRFGLAWGLLFTGLLLYMTIAYP